MKNLFVAIGLSLVCLPAAAANINDGTAQGVSASTSIIELAANYVCRIPCSASGDSYGSYDRYAVTIDAYSVSAAKKYATDNHPGLCQSVGLKWVRHDIWCE